MAKAVVPIAKFREKFQITDTDQIMPRLHELVAQFLHETPVKDTRAKADDKEELKTR